MVFLFVYKPFLCHTQKTKQQQIYLMKNFARGVTTVKLPLPLAAISGLLRSTRESCFRQFLIISTELYK